MDRDDLILRGIEIFFVAIIIGVGFLVFYGMRYDQRMLEQCKADGHKEYECVSMLRSNRSTTTVMPIYMRH